MTENYSELPDAELYLRFCDANILISNQVQTVFIELMLQRRNQSSVDFDFLESASNVCEHLSAIARLLGLDTKLLDVDALCHEMGRRSGS